MKTMPRPLLTKRFTDAVDFALVAHAAQVRKGTSIPYLSHVLAVASLVIEHQGSEDAAIAAVLHDVPEDAGGEAMLEQIRARFGDAVAEIVAGCTDTFDDPKPPWKPRKEKYIEHLARVENVHTCLVSSADKLHNARAILHDLRAANDVSSVWNRFTVAEPCIGWYYGTLEKVLSDKLGETDGKEIIIELHHVLNAIAAISGSSQFGDGLANGRKEAPCPANCYDEQKQTASVP